MKKKKKLQTLTIGIIVLIVFGIFVVYGVMNSENNEFRNFVIEEVEKNVGEGNTIVVNSVVLASKKITINDIVITIKDSKLYINDVLKDVSGEQISKVTGYYYQPANTYSLFVLTSDDKVYKLTSFFETEITEYDFEYTELDNVDELVLVDITIENDLVGQLPERNRVYASIEEELVLVG